MAVIPGRAVAVFDLRALLKSGFLVKTSQAAVIPYYGGGLKVSLPWK